MIQIAFFGHDSSDAAVQRRAAAFVDDGYSVQGFMMRRRDHGPHAWDIVNLGETRDGAFFHRAIQIVRGARLAARQRDKLQSADLIYARNLDMLACAFLAKRFARLKTPVIYECLDVHRLLTRRDLAGSVMRWIERSLLRRTRGLVVSSPAFLRNHFEPHHAGLFRAFLVENRLPEHAKRGPRPAPADTASSEIRPLNLGWVGMLRCRRSLDLLCDLARRYPDDLVIQLHGRPAKTEIPDFDEQISGLANLSYHGPYRAPDDLERIYASLDLVWAGDFMEAGFNSVWLLPNRIYEGGYYNTPPIAPMETETGAWVGRYQCGFTLPEPLERTLPDLVGCLIKNRAAVVEKARRLHAMPDDVFVQPQGFLRQIVESTLKMDTAT
jgi:succinoglycan biosynthesis protein ExoL